MTAEQFNIFWNFCYPGANPISHDLRYFFPDRWFRIHSLPKSKRYADNEDEWTILLERQNAIITDFLGENSSMLLVTGGHYSEGFIELHPIEEVTSIADISFIYLDTIDLNKLSPEEYDEGQVYRPMFNEQEWQINRFDNILKDIAEDQLRAFFISIKNGCIVAPYDGGIDLICKDQKTKNFYKEKYKEWLSDRQDGL